MINLDAVTLFSILTIVGSIVVLAVIGLKAWKKIFSASAAENSGFGDDHE